LGGILIESDKDLFRDKYISQVMDMAKNDWNNNNCRNYNDLMVFN
jgi:hypothetical protein